MLTDIGHRVHRRIVELSAIKLICSRHEIPDAFVNLVPHPAEYGEAFLFTHRLRPQDHQKASADECCCRERWGTILSRVADGDDIREIIPGVSRTHFWIVAGDIDATSLITFTANGFSVVGSACAVDFKICPPALSGKIPPPSGCGRSFRYKETELSISSECLFLASLGWMRLAGRNTDIAECGEIFPLKIEGDVHQADQHRHFDQRADHGRKRGPGVDPEHRDRHRDRQLEVVAGGGKGDVAVFE